MEDIKKAIDVLNNIGKYIVNQDEYGICYRPELVKAIEVAIKVMSEELNNK